MKIDQISEDGIRRLVDEFYAGSAPIPSLLRSSIALSPAAGAYTSRRCATSGRQ